MRRYDTAALNSTITLEFEVNAWPYNLSSINYTSGALGRAVHVDPIRLTLTAPGMKQFKL